MTPAPHSQGEYALRQTEAARRVLVDVGQVLASFADCLVLVGGWIPDLLLPDTDPPHVGSIDVDFVLDAARLNDGRYAALVTLLLETGRYRAGEKTFQLVVDVDLEDGEPPLQVEVDFLAPDDVKTEKNNPKLIGDFRVLKVESAREAFRNPQSLRLSGRNVRGAENTVVLQVVSIADFLVMKAHAIGRRDKPKDVYDLCYCLEHFPDGMDPLAADWKLRTDNKTVAKAVEILREKFAAVETYGPQQLAVFHAALDAETRTMHARRAFELVRKFLSQV
ncbi:MAG: nucleotidyl transferase AbiEii/AbiGii toxin family protein [Candidatus Binatia bacterium]